VFNKNSAWGYGNHMVGLWGMILFGIITNRAIIVDDPGFVEKAIVWPFKKWSYYSAQEVVSKHRTGRYSLTNDQCFSDEGELAKPLETGDLEALYPEPVVHWATNCPSFHFIARNPKCIFHIH
jgi:hypothetical protein